MSFGDDDGPHGTSIHSIYRGFTWGQFLIRDPDVDTRRHFGRHRLVILILTRQQTTDVDFYLESRKTGLHSLHLVVTTSSSVMSRPFQNTSLWKLCKQTQRSSVPSFWHTHTKEEKKCWYLKSNRMAIVLFRQRIRLKRKTCCEEDNGRRQPPPLQGHLVLTSVHRLHCSCFAALQRTEQNGLVHRLL